MTKKLKVPEVWDLVRRDTIWKWRYYGIIDEVRSTDAWPYCKIIIYANELYWIKTPCDDIEKWFWSPYWYWYWYLKLSEEDIKQYHLDIESEIEELKYKISEIRKERSDAVKQYRKVSKIILLFWE